MLQKLVTPEELSGILNWALKGLKRLLRNGRFSGAKSAIAVREQYERGADAIKTFLEECVETDGKSFITKDKLFEAFCEYCNKYNVPISYTKRTFGTRIKKIYVESAQSIDGKTCRVWQGVKLLTHATHVNSPMAIRSKECRRVGRKNVRSVSSALEEYE